ncbi:acyl carrier protein [Saccharothrix deserti]|uniref:acyl carrier protein n=1 Tax=Saccharothrix deserti TaxID=2593674 RepID=UPI00131D9922|nr:acyl carrier protein [Saccharothrix deserti]
MPDVTTKVSEFLQRHVSERVELRREDDIFATGLVNSLLALQLVVFVEHEFALVVADEDLNLDNFRSIAAIERFVARKLAR